MDFDTTDPNYEKWMFKIPQSPVAKEYVIREIYEGDYSPQSFAEQLERALERKHPIIIIEPTTLGEETAHWIGVGNFIHKSAVITGLGSIIICCIWPQSNPIIYTPLGGFSLLCSALYTVSWQFDNCVNYQVKKDFWGKRLKKEERERKDVILVRQERREKYRRRLHCSVSLIAAAICSYHIYRYLN